MCVWIPMVTEIKQLNTPDVFPLDSFVELNKERIL
jgi:hypothetical protein